MAVESQMLPLGTQAPAFTLPTPDGRTVDISDLASARGLLVMFVCNHCPFVKHVAEPLGDHAGKWTAEGIAVVAIMSNDFETYPEDSPEEMARFASASGWDFPYLIDEDQSVARAYSAACTPDFFLFDADRRLTYRGRMDAARPGNGVPVTAEDLQAAIDALLAGADPLGDQLPSMGCSIKWKPGTEPDWAR